LVSPACVGIAAPRALAAFVKRPQAALLKSALVIFYKRPIFSGQTNDFIFLDEAIEIIFFFAAFRGWLLPFRRFRGELALSKSQ
jgi:hypothetical protein